jgi:hypothetical protein
MEDYLDEIYQYLDQPQRYERYIVALCPFHNDTRPSFFIYPDRYYCRSCNVNGLTKSLLYDLKKKQQLFIPRKQKVFRSPWSEWESRYNDLENILILAHKNLIDKNKTAYLYKRGIELDTIKTLQLGWLDDWITFPIWNAKGEIIGATARVGETNKSSAKYCNYPGMNPNILYVPDWEMIECHTTIYLVFGILDTVSLYQLGYSSLSTTTGKRVDPSAFDEFRKKIVIIPDENEEKDAIWLSSKLGWRGSVMKMIYPEGTKDCNDLLNKRKGYLLAMLENRYGNHTN